jgi:flagellar assembly protein FliH
VRQAISVLPASARNIKVHLHPEDAQLVREILSMENGAEEERRWSIVEDGTLTRGGCKVESDTSRIDSTVESRLATVINEVLGGERESDESSDAG